MKKGDRYLCVRDVVMNPRGNKAYTEGLVYLCEEDGCLTDDQGEVFHKWEGYNPDRYFVRVNKSQNFTILYEKLSGY